MWPVATEGARWNQPVRRLLAATEQDLGDLPAGKRQLHGPPDFRVVHWRNVGAESDVGRGQDRRYVELRQERTLFVRDAIDRLNRHAGDVDLVGLVEVERVGRARPKAEGDPPQVRHTPTYCSLACELQLYFRLPDVDHIGAGSVRVSPPFATARDVIGIDDRGRRRGELHQERRARRLEVDLQRAIVDDPESCQLARFARITSSAPTMSPGKRDPPAPRPRQRPSAG